MNEKEKADFYIAMCKCCLVAKAMKTCSVCRFSTGLTEQVKPLSSETSTVLLPTAIFVMAEQCELG